MEEANKLIGTGKKHLVMGKVVEAVSALQEACGMLAEKYGDTADECGEAFLWCGKALLELARMENSVLGNALEGVPEEEEGEDKANDSKFESTENLDENTRDELRVQVYDAMAEKAEGKEGEDTDKMETGEKRPKAEAEGENKGDADAVESKEGKAEEEKDTKKKSPEKTATEEKSAGEETLASKESTEAKEKSTSQEEESAEKEDSSEKQEEGAEEEEEGEDVEMESDAEDQDEEDASAEKEEEEVGNLQLAWEMLELAKVIYKRNESKDGQLLAAQAHLKLGEVSAESGNYSQALEDFQECLKLQLAHLDLDSRLLAETHYQLGVTYNLNSQFSEAVASFNSSASVIKSRLEKLQKTISKTEETLQSDKKELEELKALLPEIQEKVEDATESQKSAAAAMKIILEGASTSSAFPASSDGPSSSTSAVAAASPSKLNSPNKSTSAAPVSDISHLVRKKVRPDPRKQEESPVKEGAVKKVKQDDAEEPQNSGDRKVNGSSNGHAKVAEVAKE